MNCSLVFQNINNTIENIIEKERELNINLSFLDIYHYTRILKNNFEMSITHSNL